MKPSFKSLVKRNIKRMVACQCLSVGYPWQAAILGGVDVEISKQDHNISLERTLKWGNSLVSFEWGCIFSATIKKKKKCRKM